MGCEGGCCISEYLVRTSELRNVERKIKKYETRRGVKTGRKGSGAICSFNRIIPSSSYRLGVKSAPCYEIYPAPLTEALRDAFVIYFDRSMPGYYNEECLFHSVETRTSSPLRVSRDSESLTAIGIENMFPVGEEAGFAGGIVRGCFGSTLW
jgi:uncharacterized FAD-dependent dehydrogenase